MDKEMKKIVQKFSQLNGASFVGLMYTSKTTGETAKHLILTSFSYENAVEKDLRTLKEATFEEIKKLAEQYEHSIDLVIQAIETKIDSFIKNQNPETRSNQSIAQNETYVYADNCKAIARHLTDNKIYINAMSLHKTVLVEGNYKTVKSRDLTIAKNHVEKYFNLSTAKFRRFCVTHENFHKVNVGKEHLSLM